MMCLINANNYLTIQSLIYRKLVLTGRIRQGRKHQVGLDQQFFVSPHGIRIRWSVVSGKIVSTVGSLLTLRKLASTYFKTLLIQLGRVITLAMRLHISAVVCGLNYLLARSIFSTLLMISITCSVLYLYFVFALIRESFDFESFRVSCHFSQFYKTLLMFFLNSFIYF